METKNYDRPLLKISGASQFLEIVKGDYLEKLDKVYLNFCQYNDQLQAGSKITDNVQIYLGVLEAYSIAQEYFSGKLSKKAQIALKRQQEGGYKYAAPILSKLGGVSSRKLVAMNKARADGLSLSRSFKITPGAKKPWIISAESGPGEENQTGLIVPKYSRPEHIIRIPMDSDQMGQFCSLLTLLGQFWISRKMS